MYCKKCGELIKEHSKFCTTCGDKLEDIQEVSLKQTNKDPKKTRKSKFILFGILALLILAIGTTGALIVITRNRKVIDTFGGSVNELKESIEEGSLGNEKDEYMKLLDECYLVLNNKDIKKMKVLSSEIEEAKIEIEDLNTQLLEFIAFKDGYDDFYDSFVVSETDTKKYTELMQNLDKAIETVNIKDGKEAMVDIKLLKERIVADNRTQTNELKEQLEKQFPSNLLKGDINIIQELKNEVEKSLEEENYLHAFDKLKEWEHFINVINDQSSNYAININQVDVSEYPNIKVYLRLENLSNNQVVDHLKLEYFYLSEKIDEGDYIKKKIKKAVQLNELEHINIVADVSGSMKGGPLTHAKSVMKNFTNTMQFDIGDKVSLISFADNVQMNLPASSDSRELINAIDSMRTGDLTSLYDALYVSINQIAQQNGAKCIIAFTDGKDNNSQCTPQIVTQLATRYNIPIFIIGVGTSIDSDNLNYIANNTGGFYRNINSITSMGEIYNAIYRQEKELYLVEYETDQSKDTILNRDIYIKYFDNNIGARSEYAYTPSVLMESSVSSAQLFLNDFIIFDSDSRYLTVADLKQLTQEQLRLARNEIYARRGRMFKDNALQEYFNSKSWYRPCIQPDEFNESMFNDYERANAYFIRDYEKLYGFN